MYELLTEVLIILIQVIGVIVGGFLIRYIKDKIGEESFKNYYSIAKIVVAAVEQTIGAGHGADKKQEAIQVLRNLTKWKLTDEQADKIIEAAVYEMNQILRMNGFKK